jgi:uncharacterized membrane protein YbhN (UPF0104 family)
VSLRRGFLLAVSFALSGILIVALIKIGRINLYATFEHLRDVSAVAFAGLVALTALHIYLSSLKWRKIDAFLRRSSDSAPSAAASFAITSVGVVCGQVLPVQISMSAARTVGTYFYGSPLKRGTAGTLYEQSFDVFIVGFLAIASGVTWFSKGGAAVYMIAATIMTIFAVLAVGPSIRFARSVLSATANSKWARNRVIRRFADLEQSGFLNAGLARQLMMLSAARFVVQILMVGQVAEAVGAHVSIWQLAAATPLAALAYALAITPGGLGVTELGYAFALHLFGTPVAVAAQWALENRILVLASCFVVAGIGVAALGLERALVFKFARDGGKRS